MNKSIKKLFTTNTDDENLEQSPREQEGKLRTSRILLATITLSLLLILMTLHLNAGYTALHLGEVSPVEVRAGHSVYYVNSVRTKDLKRAAENAVAPVYSQLPDAQIDAERSMRSLFQQAANERSNLQSSGNNSRSAINRAVSSSQFNSMLSGSAVRKMLTEPATVFEHVENVTERLVNNAMQREIRNNGSDLNQTRNEVKKQIANSLPDKEDAALADTVANEALRPNWVLNAQRTTEAREAAARSQPPDMERLLPGDRILTAGQIVNREALDKLRALGLVSQNQEITTTVVTSLLALLMTGIALVYMSRGLPAIYSDTRRMALLATIVLSSLFAMKVGAALFGLQISGAQTGYLSVVSVTAGGMLVCVLLDTNLAVLIVALLSVQAGLLMNFELRFTVMTLISGLAGVACANPARKRSNLPFVAFTLIAVNIGMVWLLGMLFSDTFTEIVRATAWAAAAAAMSLFLHWTGAMLLERPFGILTHSSLLELSSTDKPLLQQLCARAPGTYAHSIMVGTLAETAAREIGADALLCRVGGYYHDIGKMNHPEFFIENQKRENVHSKLSPSLSALLIIGHVRDGIAMAKEARLPDEIKDMIAQHHGTTLIQYFYHRALTDEGISDCPPAGMEDRFRYPGPKPQTRETAIVMLADSVEAAARSLDKPDSEQIEALVTAIFRSKIEDGQLDDSSLTFRDTHLISESFLHVMGATMHSRVKYPWQMKESSEENGSAVVTGSTSTQTSGTYSVHTPFINSSLAALNRMSQVQGELPAPDNPRSEAAIYDPELQYVDYYLNKSEYHPSDETSS